MAPILRSGKKSALEFFTVRFLFSRSSFSWFMLEGNQEGDDWRFFGKVVSHLCPDGELGYTNLSQIKEIRGSLGLPVERDMYFSGGTVESFRDYYSKNGSLNGC